VASGVSVSTDAVRVNARISLVGKVAIVWACRIRAVGVVAGQASAGVSARVAGVSSQASAGVSTRVTGVAVSANVVRVNARVGLVAKTAIVGTGRVRAVGVVGTSVSAVSGVASQASRVSCGVAGVASVASSTSGVTVAADLVGINPRVELVGELAVVRPSGV
jgi:hypothetical protein